MDPHDIKMPRRIYCECKKHKIPLKFKRFKRFKGDAIVIQVSPCPQCKKEATEKASLNMALKLIDERRLPIRK